MHRFAVLTALATFCLIWVGGLVTSHGVGMSVPDWPTTYGYNMFLFPFSKWVGGIFYEHSHRLIASGVGLLTVVLAIWLWVKEPRRWVRWLGVLAVVAVIGQGVLGGLRVTAMKDVLGVFHATLAQMFFVLMSALALFTSRWWRRREGQGGAAGWKFRPGLVLVTGLIFFQLILGASMRHQHAGLAIGDFPSAYGKLWPATDSASIATYNQQRGEVRALNPITAGGVVLQMAHRLTALVIVLAVVWLAGATRRVMGAASVPGRLALAWMLLIAVQAGLGALTIWTNKAADIATAHVAVGALSLVTGSLLALITARAGAGQPVVRDSSLTEGAAGFDARREKLHA